jgi:hypothetical protein
MSKHERVGPCGEQPDFIRSEVPTLYEMGHDRRTEHPRPEGKVDNHHEEWDQKSFLGKRVLKTEISWQVGGAGAPDNGETGTPPGRSGAGGPGA